MKTINNYIEHTLLKPDSTKDDIIKLCKEAVEHKLYGVCVPPYFVQLAKKEIKKSNVKIISVIGFPFGYDTVASKVEETKKAIISGADEIDMVINVAAFKSGDDATVLNDLQAVIMACHLQNKIAKVIIETAYLTKEEIEKACRMCVESDADFVKTSTGFASRGASIEDIEIMRKVLPTKIKIKAAGGIRDRKTAEDFIKAGADRIGTSAGVAIVGTTDEAALNA
ncbi:MAG: deoxyribose-phosphate aldolase [Bacteroidia bacterium]|nr:deoxyribose-phosphate aldolase [Bacteroidia bacterium]